VILKKEKREKYAAISAGDVLIAELGVRLAKNVSPKITADDVAYAVSKATDYCKSAETIENGKRKWYGRSFDRENGTNLTPVVQAVETFKMGKLKDLENENKELRELRFTKTYLAYLVAKRKPLMIHRAQWHLDRFLTVDEDLGKEIEELRTKLNNYASIPDEDRPFVAAICGEPGTGKSMLAKALAQAIGREYLESNAAQWTSIDDLFSLCERVRSAQIRKDKTPPVVFIDEIDSQIDNQTIYGKLLAPLWDRSYTSHGFPRDLGPTIFILAGSNQYWKSSEALMNFNKHPRTKNDSHKLDDLVSRFSTLPITIKPLTVYGKGRSFNVRVDALYLAAFQFKKRFPNAKSVSKGLLELITTNRPLHDSRSIVQVIKTLDLREKAGRIECDVETIKLHESALKLHLDVNLGINWENDGDVLISD
jgi:DNA replication protein DnaC